MRRGSHRADAGRRRWPLAVGIVLAVAALAVAVWYVLFRTAELESAGERGVPEFAFDLGRVGGASVGDRAPEETMRQAAQRIRRLLSDMYVAGFVDPAKWRNGTFPEVLEAFAEEARPRARRNIEILSLGADASQVEFMDPVASRLNIRFLVDEEQQLTAAIAATNFTAQGGLKAGGPAFSGHRATYYLQPEGRRWLIVGYDAHVQVGAGHLPEAGPQPGPTAQETAG